MKKKLLYTLATAVMLFVFGAVNMPTTNFDEPPPLCNPFTDPRCK